LTSRPTAQTSIQLRLFRWLLLPLVGTVAVTAILAYPIAFYPARLTYDWALLDTAHSLSRLLQAKNGRLSLRLGPSTDALLRTDYFDRVYYSVHDRNGTFIGGDRQLPMPPLDLLAGGELVYDSRIGSEPVRVAVLLVHLDGADAVVQVAETNVKRQTLVRQILAGVIFIEVLSLGTIVILVWFGIGKGLEPLQRLSEEIETRSHRDLRPVPEDRSPTEMRPVVRALNDLLRQLEGALHAQQQFVANAAHQLRTPLAGLRMQIEYGLQRNDPREWQRALQRLEATTARTVHLIHQLLTLAKAEVGASQQESMRQLDLRFVAEEVAEQWMPKAIAKEIDLGFELNGAPVRGDAFLLGELLSNLVDNAISYTPHGGRVTVRSRVRGNATVLEVEDDGTGIPEDEREKVFRRFHRVTGSPGEGCGLGLAIVQEIAYLHQGTVSIQSAAGGRGTLVTVNLPKADEPVEVPTARMDRRGAMT
jgi:two-component system, OmpR family, sensor histidine kinase TctE